MSTPKPIQDVINAFSRLPGIGPKTAARLAFFLLSAGDDLAQDLANSILALKTEIITCPECFNIMARGKEACDICSDEQRDRSQICVVEDAMDVLALERVGAYQGLYHVLQGVLSPIEGIGPQDLRMEELVKRLQKGEVQEVIIATNPSMEGDATAMFLQQRLQSFGVRITRLARGLPVGSDLEYADPTTLVRALSGRQEMS
jgi:recombination protein RecR